MRNPKNVVPLHVCIILTPFYTQKVVIILHICNINSRLSQKNKLFLFLYRNHWVTLSIFSYFHIALFLTKFLYFYFLLNTKKHCIQGYWMRFLGRIKVDFRTLAKYRLYRELPDQKQFKLFPIFRQHAIPNIALFPLNSIYTRLK